VRASSARARVSAPAAPPRPQRSGPSAGRARAHGRDASAAPAAAMGDYWHRTLSTVRMERPSGPPVTAVHPVEPSPQYDAGAHVPRKRLMATAAGEPVGLARVGEVVPWPPSMGKYNPLTAEWVQPPVNWRSRMAPEGLSLESRKPAPHAEIGRYNPVRNEWLAKPRNKRLVAREIVHGTVRMSDPPDRTGNFNPLTGQWRKEPKDVKAAERIDRETKCLMYGPGKKCYSTEAPAMHKNAPSKPETTHKPSGAGKGVRHIPGYATNRGHLNASFEPTDCGPGAAF